MDSVMIINPDKGKTYTSNKIKIASFDFDFTLVKTKSNLKFPIDENDWCMWDKSVLPKLIDMVKQNYKLVIFSNQNGVTSGQTTMETIRKRFQNFIDFTKLEWVCLASTKKDSFRKPGISMWDYIYDKYNIDLTQSFFVGDAAGRLKTKEIKKDFSCSDRKFAFNIGIKFFTPEEFFLNKSICNKFEIKGYNPFNYNFSNKCKKISIKLNKKQMVILIGCPCSGKSTFAKKYFSDYVNINLDNLKTKKKCLTLTENTLKNNDSVIIDNTNPDYETRKEYIDIAKKYNFEVIAYVFNMNKDMGIHMNWYRCKTSNREFIPLVVFHIFFKKLKIPIIDEGFINIINIVPQLEFTPEQKKIFLQLT